MNWYDPPSETTERLPLAIDGARKLLTYSRESNERLLGIFGQEQEIALWAERNGYQLIQGAHDINVKGIVPVDQRTGLTAVLHAIQTPDIAGLVVQHLDRIARNVDVMRDAITRIWDAHRDIFAINFGRIPRTRAGMELCLEVARGAAYEMERITTRLQGARKLKAAHGGYHGGYRIRRKYGVELVDINGTLEYRPIPSEQAVIHWICKAHAEGLGYLRIANALNHNGTPTATGAPWRPKVVRDLILRGPDRPQLLPPTTTRADLLVLPRRQAEMR